MKPQFLLLLIFVAPLVGGNGLDGLLDLGQFGLDGGGGLGELKLDEQMAQRVRALIKHFKADDPVGLPEGMLPIKEPITVPNLEQTFSGTKMKFENISLYGINKFRLDHVRVALSDLKIGVGLSIDELFVEGLYQMSAWFTRAKGNFSVTITKVETEAKVSFEVDDEGNLQVQQVEMDVKFGDLKMDFQNLGFFGSIFQGMINSVGSFLFDSIKPMILGEVEGKVRGELNRQARSVPQQFPNSISPVDMFIASGRAYMREKGLDPFPIPEQHLSSWSYGNFELSEGTLYGLSSIHRTGPLIISFEDNIVHVSLSLGAADLKGELNWSWGIFKGLIGREGSLQFTVEQISVNVQVGQPANLDKLTTIDHLDIELGNIAVISDGAGTIDYVIEALVNILPNLLRKQIVDSLEDPLREFVQTEIQKRIQIENMIEQHLPKN